MATPPAPIAPPIVPIALPLMTSFAPPSYPKTVPRSCPLAKHPMTATPPSCPIAPPPPIPTLSPCPKVTVASPSTCPVDTSPSPMTTTPQMELLPFAHQVAGQSLILRYDVTTICKSVIPQERLFYLNFPGLLRPHAPEFRGIVHLPLSTDSGPQSQEDGQTDRRSIPNLQHLPTNRARGLRKSSSSGLMDGRVLYEFLLMEDLISNFRKPCVLDLKVGTRQHGDDAPADKVAYQVNKCKATTSGSLGLRLCGMKKYNPSTQKFEQRGRDHGRKLDDRGFREEVANFLSDGADVRRGVVAAILKRLDSMCEVIERLDGFRFYSCSILIVYEADVIGIPSSSCPDFDKERVHAKVPQPFSERTQEEVRTCVLNGVLPQNLSSSSQGLSCVKGDSTSGGIVNSETPCIRTDTQRRNETCDDNPKSVNSSHENKCQNGFDENSGSVLFDLGVSSSRGSENQSISSADVTTDSMPEKHDVCENETGSNFTPDQTCNPPRAQQSLTNGCLLQNSTDVAEHPRNSLSSEQTVKHVDSQQKHCDLSSEQSSDSVKLNSKCCNPAKENPLSACGDEIPRVVRNEESVEVRIVDFAHATYPGFQYESGLIKDHKGPDHGFLVGIRSLMDILRDLQGLADS